MLFYDFIDRVKKISSSFDQVCLVFEFIEIDNKATAGKETRYQIFDNANIEYITFQQVFVSY